LRTNSLIYLISRDRRGYLIGQALLCEAFHKLAGWTELYGAAMSALRQKQLNGLPFATPIVAPEIE